MMARNLITASGRCARMSFHRASNMAAASQSQARWFSAASSVPTYRSMSDSAKGSGGDSFEKICFIGAGKMAESMITPIIKTGIMPAECVSIYDVSNKTMDRIRKQHEGIQTSTSIPDAISGADLIVMAVKPQNCPTVFDEIRRAREMTADASNGVHLNEDATLLSVIAGKPISSYVNGTGLEKIARSMPNTPAQIGRGMTVWSCTGAVDATEKVLLKEVLSSFGKEIFVEDESFIDMSTSISGSGPAYIFLLMEAMIDAGVHMGFSRDTASTLVHHTLLGSTLYAMETGEHPAVLRNSVTSPAGTTASAIYELENGKFRTVIKDAICTYQIRAVFSAFDSFLVCDFLMFYLMFEFLSHFICMKMQGPAIGVLWRWVVTARM